MIKRIGRRVLSFLIAATFTFPAFADKLKLALNWKPEPEFGGFFEAQRAGYFKELGLDVEILPGGSGQPTVQMIAAGTVPFGIVSADEVLLARSNGADVVAIYAAFQTNPQCIMTHAPKLEDIFRAKPKTLAIQKGLGYAKYLEKHYGFKSLNIVPYQGGVTQFLTDSNFGQQCFAFAEPLIAKKHGIEPVVFMIAEAGYNPYTVVLATRRANIDKQGDQVKKMVTAVRRGWQTYLVNPEATNAMMAKLNPAMDPAIFAESAKALQPLVQTGETDKTGLGTMSAERWNKLQDQLVELDMLTAKVDVATAFWNVP